ncbi:MAG: hypothetical protein N2A40_05185 [Desulfobulbaceae bacterium]
MAFISCMLARAAICRSAADGLQGQMSSVARMHLPSVLAAWSRFGRKPERRMRRNG